jgi:hypothetical protein
LVNDEPRLSDAGLAEKSVALWRQMSHGIVVTMPGAVWPQKGARETKKEEFEISSL